MALCVTAGRTNNCATPISGGVSAIYIVDKGDIDVVTVGVGGDVTGITMQVGAVFYKFEFAANTAQFTEALTNENCATQVTQSIKSNWYGRSQTDINSIMELANCCCGLAVIHVENNGNMYIWGYSDTEEAFLFTANGDSGTAKSDANQEEVTLQAQATTKAKTFTGTIPV